MPPFLLRWLVLLLIRFVTLTALIYTFVTSIVQLHQSLQAVRAPQESTTVLPSFPSDNKTTTIVQVPLNKLYGDSDVPLTTTGPFFTVLHYLFLLASTLIITIAELPLPSFIQRKLRLQDVLETLLPQLCHKYNSTGLLGLWLLLLSAGINSRPVGKLERAGGWLLLLAGSLNIITALLFRKRNLKHLRSLDVRKAALAAAGSSPLASKITTTVKNYGWDQPMEEATVAFERSIREGRSAGLPRPATSPNRNKGKQRRDSLAARMARFSNYVMKTRHKDSMKRADSDQHYRYNQEAPAFTERKQSITPIYDMYATNIEPASISHAPVHHLRRESSEQLTHYPAQYDLDTSQFRLANPFEAGAEVSSQLGTPRDQQVRRRRSSVCTLSSRQQYISEEALAQNVNRHPMAPSPAERSPGIVSAWREAAHEARRQARLANAKARRSLLIVKQAQKTAKNELGKDPDKYRRPRGVAVEYRRTSIASNLRPAESDHEREGSIEATATRRAPEHDDTSKRDSAAVVRSLLERAAPRNEHRQPWEKAGQNRHRRPSQAPSIDHPAQEKVQHEGISFQLIDTKSTRAKRRSSTKVQPPPYRYV